MKHSIRRITKIFNISEAKSYLEIGVNRGETFNFLPEIEEKTAVDPKFLFNTEEYASQNTHFFEKTSDDFFKSLPSEKKFDVIFLDGLHTFEQTFRDFCASLPHSNDKTVWVIDDVLPRDIFSAHREMQKAFQFRKMAGDKNRAWHGDVYKVVYAINDFFPSLKIQTIKDGGNPQSIVWQEPRGEFTPIFSDLERISRMTFYDLHANIGAYHFRSEVDVLEELAEDFSNKLNL